MEEHKCDFKKDDGFMDLRNGKELYRCKCGKQELRPRPVNKDHLPDNLVKNST